jgi:hypothetical protein
MGTCLQGMSRYQEKMTERFIWAAEQVGIWGLKGYGEIKSIKNT